MKNNIVDFNLMPGSVNNINYNDFNKICSMIKVILAHKDIIDPNDEKLMETLSIFSSNLFCVLSDEEQLKDYISFADMLV